MNFEKMSLFQLMNWVEENNYDENYMPIVNEVDDMGYNPFENMPDNYSGTLEEWEVELDEIETLLKQEYIKSCKIIQAKKN